MTSARETIIDDLSRADMAALRKEVERLCFYTRIRGSHPFQVLPLQLRIGRCLGLLSDGAQSRGTVDGLLRTRDVGNSDIVRVLLDML